MDTDSYRDEKDSLYYDKNTLKKKTKETEKQELLNSLQDYDEVEEPGLSDQVASSIHRSRKS